MKIRKYSLQIVMFCFVIASLNSGSVVAQNLWEFNPEYDYSEHPMFEGIETVDESELGEWYIIRKLYELSEEDESIVVAIKPDVELTFNRSFAFMDNDGVLIWEGESSYLGTEISAYFTTYQGELKGYIEMNSTSAFRLIGIGDDHYIYTAVKNSAECNSHLIPYFESTLPNSSASTSQTSFHCNGLRIYRMVIAYTPEFYNSFTGANPQQQVNQYLKDIVQVTNETYISSGSNVRVRLAFSYKTTDNEVGNKGDDLKAFQYPDIPFMAYTGRYDEIFAYRNLYRADACILLVSYSDGGRAARQLNMAVYSKDGAGWWSDYSKKNYGVAHEVGHLFNLDHNREEYNWFEKAFLDHKKAYGHRGVSYRTVMASYDNQQRMSIYSDPGLSYPNGATAGSNRAKARNYIQAHQHNLFTYDDLVSELMIGQVIEGNQMVSKFAFNNLHVMNYNVKPGAEVKLRAEHDIVLSPNTFIEAGATFSATITPCINSQVFRNKSENTEESEFSELSIEKNEEIDIYPNPTSSSIRIEKQLTQSTDYEIKLYNATAQLVKSMEGKSDYIQQDLDLSNLDEGVYVLKIQIGGQVIVRRIVKN